MTAMYGARVLLLLSVAVSCHAGMVHRVLDKLYGMEKSLHQDIGFLRESVESNRLTLESVMDILNTSNLDTRITDNVEMANENDTVGNIAYTHLQEDVVRVKRAFAEEKLHARQKESQLQTALDTLTERIAERLDTITDAVSDLAAKAGDIGTPPTNLAVLKEPARESDDLGELMETLTQNQDILIEHLTGIVKDVSNVNATVMATALVQLMQLSKLGKNLDAMVKISAIRLVHGNTLSSQSGRLEVLLEGRWGTVCDDDFDNTDATVVCRALGFSAGEAKGGAFYGEGSGTIWLDDVDCDGDEEHLFECKSPQAVVGVTDCSHDEDVGVQCT